ncbi:MOSC domain-containing protein [Croceicoccus sp. F390]|uniref:MOSC domain-containing protein n=1 Tax=Croceicoccus esteveae TaxID=3075597 RepID=A0ABU2ZKS7_9SPHN|nr:MOSC N-terminal beta barrel domain-containing protein [Croceicoccus sp. F390]MDT0576991.1 MOSC domain-containing protein [Croceicoccus sp. F390]
MNTELPELSVAQIWRYPVKSMGGERLEQAEVGRRGLVWDRGWAVRDEKIGVTRSARYIPRLLLCSARYLPGTSAGTVPHVEITLPDGSLVGSDDPGVHQRLSTAIGREVTLVSTGSLSGEAMSRQAPYETGDFETEMRMIFGLKDDEPLPDMQAMMKDVSRSDVFMQTFHDSFSINVLTTSSIRHLQNHVPSANLDVQRFRSNIIVDDGGECDFERELEWIGKRIAAGPAIFDVVAGCARCTIIAAAQQGGIARDLTITRTVVREMKQVMGIYCNVHQDGIIRTGDAVTVLNDDAAGA